MRVRISCSRAGTRRAMPRAPFRRPTSRAKPARTFSRCSRVVSIASIFARQSPILISLIPLLPLHPALKMTPKTKKAAFPLGVAAGLEDLVRCLVAKCWVLRARLAGPLPVIREAAGKSETVIKLITHAPWCPFKSLPRTNIRNSRGSVKRRVQKLHISSVYEFTKNYKLDLSASRTPTTKDNMQSDAIKKGISRAPARAMLKATGLTDADLARPLVAIANTWTEVTPCNFHLRALAEKVKEGVRAAGGTPIEFDTITVSDGITMGTEGMKASLVSREVIADSIELFVRAHAFDAVIAICGCDKTIPGVVMALARLNLPSLALYGGSILAGHFAGREVTIMDVFEAVGACAAGKMTEKQLGELEDVACPGAGACGGQFTANTMAMALTFLGISPMGANEIPATDPRKGKAAFDCGKTVMKLLKDDIRPRQIITPASLQNAIVSVAATGGSTNAVLHLLAIARDAEVPLKLDEFDSISAKTPLLADLKPGGRFTAPDMFRAGGMRLLGQRLHEAELLQDGITASGKSLLEEIRGASETPGQEVVRTLLNPIKKEGGLAILRGTLAPEGCVVKLAGHERLKHIGPARVFDSEEAAFDAVQKRQIQPGDVVVIRYEGPKGGPGMREMLGVT